jgi:DNA-binding CsgD family transcriptional regulator
LTDAELGVTEQVAQGLTNRQVADRLFVSRYTVDFHLRSVFRKLEVKSRVELTRRLLEHERKHNEDTMPTADTAVRRPNLARSRAS